MRRESNAPGRLDGEAESEASGEGNESEDDLHLVTGALPHAEGW